MAAPQAAEPEAPEVQAILDKLCALDKKATKSAADIDEERLIAVITWTMWGTRSRANYRLPVLTTVPKGKMPATFPLKLESVTSTRIEKKLST